MEKENERWEMLNSVKGNPSIVVMTTDVQIYASSIR
jgi:hypothetical protein